MKNEDKVKNEITKALRTQFKGRIAEICSDHGRVKFSVIPDWLEQQTVYVEVLIDSERSMRHRHEEIISAESEKI